jgi:hypothetical protein
MDAQLLQQELRNYFQSEVRRVEPSSGWWANAVARAAEEKRPAAWRMSLRRSRLIWVLIPLAALLLAGIAYASSSVIRELFERRAPWVEHAGLSQAMDLSETIDGVTVRIERAYADSNVAVVGYTIGGPPITATGVGQRYFSKPGNLSIAGGPTLGSFGGAGTVPGSQDVLGDWRPSDRLAVLATFDTSSVEGAPAELKVTLPIVVYDRVPIPEAGPATTRSYTFDFSIKFHAGTVVNVAQTVEAAGVAITLDQVRIAPWESRMSFIIGPPFDDPNDRPWPVVTITTPSGDSAEPQGGRGNWQSFYGDFSAQKGEWTMVISELNLGMVNVEWTEVEINGQKVRIGKGGETKTLAGPWVFHFNVP